MSRVFMHGIENGLRFYIRYIQYTTTHNHSI